MAASVVSRAHVGVLCTVVFVLPLLDGASQDALEELADSPALGPLVVLSCPVPGLAEEAARLMGRRFLGATAISRDFAQFSPSSEQWLVGEVEEITGRLALMPFSRHFLVVTDADVLPPRAADRLLKVLEEPPAPSTVVLTCSSLSDLPPTLLGRASAQLTLIPAPLEDQVAALVSSGASVSAAREAASLAGSRLEWAPVFAMSSEARACARKVFSPRLSPDSPVTEATSRLSGAALLARLLGDSSVASPVAFEDLLPEEKLLARRVLREFASARRRALTRALGSLSSEGVANVATCLAALDTFEVRLRANVPPFLALAALGCESPVVRLPRSAARAT